MLILRTFLKTSMKTLGIEALSYYPVCIYLLKVNNTNTRTRCKICSNLTIKTLELEQGVKYVQS